ncbi:MAG: hypothetical protein VKO39_09860 [Cyanobacteriota bacterium]|nr:hypothetical protein [Cyanobacteriota bacterium]
MRFFHVATATSVFYLGLLSAPQPSSAIGTFKANLNAAITLTSSPQNISFPGFNTFPIPPGNILTNVQLTLKGVTGGTVTATNYTPESNVFQNNLFQLKSNGSTNGQPHDYPAVTVPAATYPGGVPIPGVATANIVATNKTFQFNIWNPGITGANPGNSAAFFSTAVVSIPTSSGALPLFNPGGPYVSTDGSFFTIDSVLNNSYLTYTYDVPGPLPILGAGTFFAWSRRIRRRITKSA